MAFRLVGDRSLTRSVDEMLIVDKKEADAAFKKYQKEIIEPFMKEQGFRKYKTNAYVRKSKIDLLEYVNFQKERDGCKTFTVNLALMPLYAQHDFIVFNFRKRLGELICQRDIW